MGWLIKRQSTEAQEAIRVSFEHVKNDVSNLQSWIHHINKTNSYQQQVIDHLRGQIAHLQQAKQEAFQLTRREIRDLIDAHYSLEPVMERINKLENQLEGMKHQDSAPTTDLSPVLAKLNEIAGKISKPVERPQIIQKPSTSHLQQKVVRDVARRSKEYVKNVIYNLVQKYGQAAGLQLREIVVAEQKLVSKSSFYRLLQELEDEGRISVEQHGKEKTYTARGEKIETFK